MSLAGTRLGTYDIAALLGAGGMGEVYRLEKDPKLRLRNVADTAAFLDGPQSAVAVDHVSRGPRSWTNIAVGCVGAALITMIAIRLLRPDAGSGDLHRELTAAAIATRLTDYGGAESDAALSPDGRSFVFVSEHGGTPDIWLRQVSGGDPVRLTDDDAEENSPAYSPDGEFIYFARTDANGTAIWRMGALGAQRQKVISDISAAGGGPILIGSAPRTFSLSPDGRSIAYYQNGSILRSAIDGSSPRPIAAAAMPSAGRPGWSPDGRFLSFVRGGLFAPSNLFVLDLTTGRERQVTHFSHSVEGVYSQAWLPDSRHLVVCYVPSSRQ